MHSNKGQTAKSQFKSNSKEMFSKFVISDMNPGSSVQSWVCLGKELLRKGASRYMLRHIVVFDFIA